MNYHSGYRTFLILIILLASIGLSCGLGSRLTDEEEATPISLASATPQVDAPEIQPSPSPIATDTPPGPAPNRLPIETVVQIWTLDADGELMWSGSGSIIDAEGFILTNAHVVLPDKYYDVYGLMVSLTINEDEPPKPAYRAETIVFDEDLDLAVIRLVSDLEGKALDYASLNLPVIELGNSDEVGLGTALRILGYPGIGGETITLTSGEVAGFTNEAGVKGRAYIKTSATIAGGNSGGAGIDSEGRLIGVPTQLGYGGDDEIVDCRVLADTNNDGVIDSLDACIPTGGFINALRPINLAKPLIAEALSGETLAQATPLAEEPNRAPIKLPDNAGQVLFEDDFSTDQNNWGIIEGIAIEDGQLSLFVAEAGDYIWSTIAGEYDDLDYQVDTRKLGGPDNNSFGQIFRFQDKDNYYTYEISSDGFYVVNKLEDGVWHTLIDWTASPLIDTERGQNQIAVIMQGDSFTFLINGVQVDTARDEAFSKGSLGLLASSYDEPKVAIGFDNLLARVPGGERKIVNPLEAEAAASSLVYEDDFSRRDEGWNLESNSSVERSVEDGEFTLRVIDEQTDAWATHSVSLSDVIVEVDARKAAGPDMNNYGVMCRYIDPKNYYFLQLGSDGTYAIVRYVGGQEAMLVDWTSSPAVNTGSDANHIKAECVGNTLSLYVNETLLASVVDDALDQGKIALGAGTYDEGDVEFKFDNLRVKSPAPTAGAPPQALFYEDFSDNEADWPESASDNAEYFFSDNEYYISVLSSDYMVWARTYESWDGVAIELDVRQSDGPDDNEYGLLCRYQDSDNFYQLGVSGDGYYRLSRWLDGEFEDLLQWERSSAINQGAASNHLSALCDGERLSLSVNGRALFDLRDDGLPTKGDVALYVGTFDEGGVTIAFDDLSIANP